MHREESLVGSWLEVASCYDCVLTGDSRVFASTLRGGFESDVRTILGVFFHLVLVVCFFSAESRGFAESERDRGDPEKDIFFVFRPRHFSSWRINRRSL